MGAPHRSASPQPESVAVAPAAEPCDLCGADDFLVLFEAGVAQEGRIVRCEACRLLYVNPRQRVELADYRDRGAGETAGWELSPSSLERQRNQVRDYRKALQRVLEHAPGGRVLEIGPNTGAVLNELKTAGMQCVGLEPNSFAARYGREHYGLDLRTVTLDEAGLEAESFDAVLLLHVIEHVPSPLTLLRSIRRVLKPGGLLVVETPRYDTFMFKLFGRRERNLTDNWHLYFFETDTLKAMIEKAGFRVTDQAIPSRTVTPSRVAVNLGKMVGLNFITKMGYGMAQSKINDALALPINFRDIIRYYVVRD